MEEFMEIFIEIEDEDNNIAQRKKISDKNISFWRMEWYWIFLIGLGSIRILQTWYYIK